MFYMLSYPVNQRVSNCEAVRRERREAKILREVKGTGVHAGDGLH